MLNKSEYELKVKMRIQNQTGKNEFRKIMTTLRKKKLLGDNKIKVNLM